MTVAQIEIPEARIGELCRCNGIRRLSLFGSVLTDRFSDSSDIDVLVEFRPEARIGFHRSAQVDFPAAEQLAEFLFNLREPEDLSRHFRDEVVREARVVYAEP